MKKYNYQKIDPLENLSRDNDRSGLVKKIATMGVVLVTAGTLCLGGKMVYDEYSKIPQVTEKKSLENYNGLKTWEKYNEIFKKEDKNK